MVSIVGQHVAWGWGLCTCGALDKWVFCKSGICKLGDAGIVFIYSIM